MFKKESFMRGIGKKRQKRKFNHVFFNFIDSNKMNVLEFTKR